MVSMVAAAVAVAAAAAAAAELEGERAGGEGRRGLAGAPAQGRWGACGEAGEAEAEVGAEVGAEGGAGARGFTWAPGLGPGPPRAFAVALPVGGAAEGADLARLSDAPGHAAREGWVASEPLGPGRLLCVATPRGAAALRARGFEVLPLGAELSATPEARALAAAVSGAPGPLRLAEDGDRRLRLRLPGSSGDLGEGGELLLARRDSAGRVAFRVSGAALPASARADWGAADAQLREVLAHDCTCDADHVGGGAPGPGCAPGWGTHRPRRRRRRSPAGTLRTPRWVRRG